MSNIYDEVQINKIIELYKKNRERDRIKYQKKKDNPHFIEQNRARAKAHYQAHYKDTKKENYMKNQDFIKAKSLFYYYRRTNRIDDFKTKFPDKVKLMETHGFPVGSGSGSGSD